MNPPPSRIVALGASNLTRGLATLAAAARAGAGPGAEVFAVLGLGRSYGMRSRVLARSLPSILECGLWRALEERPALATRALITDVGNDILYGASAAHILGWVEDAILRLRRFADDVVITGLPVSPLRRLSPRRFLGFRTLFYPPSRIARADALALAEDVDRGLRGLAERHGARFVEMRDRWYGFDPVHIRRSEWSAAWGEILGMPAAPAPGWVETARALALPAERRWLFGVERVRPQRGTTLGAGGRLWLY